MAANRLTRDQIISQALDIVAAPSLDNKERPDGVTITGPLGIAFLQNALDYFYVAFPIKGTLTTVAVTFPVHQATITLPSDYLQDYQNGIILDNNKGRLTRRGLSYLLSKPTNVFDQPALYAISDDTHLLIRPLPDIQYTGVLYYYARPAALSASSIPPFPTDKVLVDYLRLAYKEWLQQAQTGVPEDFLSAQVAKLQRAGLGAEPESDQIELDRTYFGERQVDRNDWMGKTVI